MPRIGVLGSRIDSLVRGRGRELAGLGAVFGVGFVYLAVQALRVKSYAWMVDELVYTKAAQAFASSPLHTETFGQGYAVPNALYARLLAVPYGALSNLHAFTAGHVLNALLFASASIPVYLLARRLGATHIYSLLGAALVVWVPWAIAVLVLMSESAAYPAFAWAMLIAVVAIAEPRPRNDVLLVVAVIALVYARTQFIVVLPAFAIGLLVHEIAWPARTPGELAGRLRRHWVLGAFVVVASLGWLVTRPAFLGNYARTTNVPRFPPGLLDSMGDHLTHVVLGVGVAPALLFVVAIVRGGSTPLRREQHVFAYVGGLAALLLTYQAGFYSRQIAGGHLQERYMLYVAVLFAAATAFVLSEVPRRAPIGSLLAATAVLVPVAGIALFPPGVTGVLALESAASGFNDDIVRIHDSLVHSWSVGGMVAAFIGLVAIVVAAALFEHRWRRFTVPALGAAVLLFCVLQTNSLFGRLVPQVNASVPASLGSPPKAWVDGLLFSGGEKAGAVEGPLGGDAPSLWLWTEFWNSRIQRIYTPPGRVPVSALPGTRFSVDPKSGRVQTSTEMPALVVSAQDPAIRFRGQELRTIVTGQRLIRPVRPYRADFVYGDGSSTAVGSAPTELSVYPPRPGVTSARVTLALTTQAPARWVVSASGKRMTGALGKDGSVKLTLPVNVAPGQSRGVVDVSAPGIGAKGAMTVSQVDVTWG